MDWCTADREPRVIRLMRRLMMGSSLLTATSNCCSSALRRAACITAAAAAAAVCAAGMVHECTAGMEDIGCWKTEGLLLLAVLGAHVARCCEGVCLGSCAGSCGGMQGTACVPAALQRLRDLESVMGSAVG